MIATPISAIIVDNESDDRKTLELLIKNHQPNIKILSKLETSPDILDTIIELKPEIVFLDIKTNEKSGLDLILDIKKHQIGTRVILTTDFNKKNIEAVKYAAFDYLLKPINPKQLKETIRRFVCEKNNQLKQKTDLFYRVRIPKLELKTKNKILFINPKNIVCCKADGNYSSIHLVNGHTELITMQIGKLDKLISTLNFTSIIRANRSILINLDYMIEIDHKLKTVKMECEDRPVEIKISSKMLKELRKSH